MPYDAELKSHWPLSLVPLANISTAGADLEADMRYTYITTIIWQPGSARSHGPAGELSMALPIDPWPDFGEGEEGKECGRKKREDFQDYPFFKSIIHHCMVSITGLYSRAVTISLLL